MHRWAQASISNYGKSNKLRLASDENNTLIYTADGTLPQKSPKDPLLVAAKSTGELPTANLQKFALERIMQTAETKITQVRAQSDFQSRWQISGL